MGERNNRKRWQSDPEALAETIRKMNAAKLTAADKVRHKISQAAKNRWKAMSPEQRAAHITMMRAARGRRKSPSR